ncbi:MerR family transcriptional regulator [Endozoicomonas sp. OPT23]|nr:MerR family transcriptional regulator [Endozoicomonas sp. OPT23]
MYSKQIVTLFFLSLFSITAFAKTIWIDVRSAEENKIDSISGDLNIPHTDVARKIVGVTLDRNADIRLYCRSGRRSGIAKQALESLGYKNVTNSGSISHTRAMRTDE